MTFTEKYMKPFEGERVSVLKKAAEMLCEGRNHA